MTKEALKLALEWYDSGSERREVFEAMIKRILAQPVQEPVAWEQFYPDMGKGPLTAPPMPVQQAAQFNSKNAELWLSKNKLKAHEVFSQPVQETAEDYDCVTRQSAENAIEYMTNSNSRGREIDAEAMLVSAPLPVQPASEVTDARMVLVQSLVASKGWNHGYAAAFVDDWFHDRLAATTNTAPLPVQPQRQPLTEAQIDACLSVVGIKPELAFGSVYTGNVQLRNFARAIEQAHNIGGAKP